MNSQEVEMELEENEEDMPRWQRRELQEKRLQQQKEREMQKQKLENLKHDNSSDSDSDDMPKKRQRNGLRAGLRESVNSGSSLEGKPKSVLEELKSIQTANKLRKQMSLNLDSEIPSKPQYIQGSYSPQTHACPTWGDTQEAVPETKAEMINHKQVFLRQFDDLLDNKALCRNIQQSQPAELQDKILEDESNNNQQINHLDNPQSKQTQNTTKIDEKPTLDEFFKKMHQEKQEITGKSPEASPATSPTPFQFLHKKIKQVLEQEGYMVEGDNISEIRSELKKYQDDIVNQASKEYYSSQDQSLSENASIDQEVDDEKVKYEGDEYDDEDEESGIVQKKKTINTRAEKKKALEKEFQKQNSLDNEMGSTRPKRSNEMRTTLGKSLSFDCITKINSSNEDTNSPDQLKSKQQQQSKFPKIQEAEKRNRYDENQDISLSQKEKRSRNMRTSLGWNAHDNINSKGFASRDDDDEEDENTQLNKDKKKEDTLVRSVNASRFKKQNTLDPSALENLLLSKARDSSKENKSNSSERSQKQKSTKDEEDDDEDEEEEGDSSNHGRSSNHSEKVISSGKSSAKNSSEGYNGNGKGQKIFKDYCPDEKEDQEDRDSGQVDDDRDNEQQQQGQSSSSSGSQFNNYYQAKSLKNQPEFCEVIEEMESSQESITKSSLIFQQRNRQKVDEDEDDDENKDESTKNKVDEETTKVRQIVSNLEHPSTFFHYINMRESKKGRKSSNDFSDSNGSRPVSTPDLRDIECKLDESFQIDLNNINAKQSNSIILQSQEQLNLPPPQSPILSSITLPQNGLSPKRKYSGISQDDSAVNTSPKRKTSSPSKGKYQQYTIFSINDQNGGKNQGENNGIPYLNLTPVEMIQDKAEIPELIVKKEDLKSISPQSNKFATIKELTEVLVTGSAPFQPVPVNQPENIKINTSPVFELSSPYLLAKSPSPSVRSEQVADNQSNLSQQGSISREYLPFSSQDNISEPWKTVRNFVGNFYSSQNIPSATYNTNSGVAIQIPSKELEGLGELSKLPRINSAPEDNPLNQGLKKTVNATVKLDLDESISKQKQLILPQSPQSTSLQTSPVIASTTSPQPAATPFIETSKNFTLNNNKTNFIYKKQASLMSIPDYEPLGKSPNQATASPDFLTNISKFVYPTSSITVLTAENAVNENNNNLKNYHGNQTITSTNLTQTTSTVSSTQPLLVDMSQSIQVTSGIPVDKDTPLKLNSTISYIIDSKNSSMLTSSTSKTPLIDQFHQVPSFNILFPNNKSSMKYSNTSEELKTGIIPNLPSSPSNLQSSTSSSLGISKTDHKMDLLNTQKNGFGSQLNPDGSMYIGIFVDGKKQGFGKILDPSGKLFYQGQFINDCYEGEGELHNSQAAESSTEAKHNSIDVNTNTNGSWIVYSGQFKNGKKEGAGKIVYKNGDEFQGTFSNDQAQGHGQLTKSNGEIIKGMWKEGVQIEEQLKSQV